MKKRLTAMLLAALLGLFGAGCGDTEGAEQDLEGGVEGAEQELEEGAEGAEQEVDEATDG